MHHFRVLAHEDQAEFDELLAAYQSEFPAQTCHQCFRVDQLAQSRWRLARTRRLEALAFDEMLNGALDETNPDARILARLSANIKDLVTFLHRQAVAAETSYYRAYRELTQARSRELRNEANRAKSWLREQLLSSVRPSPEPAFDPTRAVPVAWTPENPFSSVAASGSVG